MISVLSDFSWPADDSTPGAILYIAGTVVMTIWMRRKEFRQGGRAAGVATLDLLSSISLAIPALAYWNSNLAEKLGDGPMRLLFVLGLLGLFGFVVYDTRAMLHHPRLNERQRRRFAAIGAAAVLLPSTLEVWWGVEAIAKIRGQTLI
jgi:hypothetical protein